MSVASVAPAQEVTPTPELLQQNQSQCPADARIRYDVTAIAGADGIRWQLRRGTPGQMPNWNTAVALDNGQQTNASGTRQLFLRTYGATMNGTPYLARVRATQGGLNIAEWSEPSAAYAPDHSPDGMYQAGAETGADGAPRIRLQWSLTGALAACADRIHYEVKKDAPFASPTGPDPAAQSGSFTGTTGNQPLSLPGGAGEYYVRLVARHGGDAPDREVGTWGAAIRVTVQPPTLVQTPTPALLKQNQSQCPADARIRYDVTSLAGADGIEWELRRGTPGTSPSWDAATPIDQGNNTGAQTSKQLFLRTYGATMNGTPYLARIRATQGGQPVAEWSQPANYAPSYSPDGMYTVASELAADGTPRIRLQWNLTGEIAACADRIGYYVGTGSPTVVGSGTGPFPTLAVRSASGKSGSELIDPAAGTTTGITPAVQPGRTVLPSSHYYVRVIAAYQGSPTQKAVSAWSGPAWTPIPKPPATAQSCDDLDPSLAPGAEMFSATPAVQTTSPPYRLRIDWSLSGTLAACADRIAYEVMKGRTFASDRLDPLTYMSETLTGTSGSYLAILPEGPDEYWVRIVARRGGDTPTHEVGARSAAKQVTVAATTRHELAVKVIDDVASSCAASTVVLPGATVRLALPDGSRQSATTDVEGIARLSALAGQYTLSANHRSCGSDSKPLTLQADHETSLRLPRCVSEGADLALRLTSSSTSPTVGEPYPLTVTVRSVGTCASGPANVTLERSDGTRTTRLLEASVPGLCRGVERTFTAEDPSPEAGKTYTYTARVHPRGTDANGDNNAASRTVAFPAPPPPVTATPVDPVPADPADAPLTSRTQPLFSRTAPAGWAFDFFCGPGAVLVGIHGMADQWVDRIGAMCARVDRSGRWVGDPYPVKLLGTVQSETVGLSPGGNPFDEQCPRDQAVVALSGRNSLLTPFSAVILTCRGLSGGAQTPLGLVGSLGGDAVWDEPCDGPAKGLLVQAGLYVDLALPDCDTRLAPSVVEPVRPRLVEVRTRRPTFEWRSSPLALEYRLCVNPTRTAANTYECGSGNLIVWTRGTSWTPGEDLPLATSGDIQWVVHACDEAFCTRGIGTTFTYGP